MDGRFRWILFLLVALMLVGCSKDDRLRVYKVRGSVTFNDQAPGGAFVTFHPKDNNMKLAAKPRASVGEDGAFTLTTYVKDDGAPTGEYDVTIEWQKPVKLPDGETQPGPNLLPARYAKPETSKLHATVNASDNELPLFRLSR